MTLDTLSFFEKVDQTPSRQAPGSFEYRALTTMT